ncbi:hypothetical protein LSAT2_016544 [Lamellibrachia satsuma]|nr:hypothetical protein LSAT2_016544 [Lamellibrachia satsuma]
MVATFYRVSTNFNLLPGFTRCSLDQQCPSGGVRAHFLARCTAWRWCCWWCFCWRRSPPCPCRRTQQAPPADSAPNKEVYSAQKSNEQMLQDRMLRARPGGSLPMTSLSKKE